MHGSYFEDYVTTVRWDRYGLMCSIEAHYLEHPTLKDDSSSGGGISLTPDSSKSILVSLGININFIYSWLKLFMINCQQVVLKKKLSKIQNSN